MSVNCCTAEYEDLPDRFCGCPGREDCARHYQARYPNATIILIHLITGLSNSEGIKPNIGEQSAICHGKEGWVIIWFCVHQKNIRLIFGNPIFVVSDQNMTIGRMCFT